MASCWAHFKCAPVANNLSTMSTVFCSADWGAGECFDDRRSHAEGTDKMSTKVDKKRGPPARSQRPAHVVYWFL